MTVNELNELLASIMSDTIAYPDRNTTERELACDVYYYSGVMDFYEIIRKHIVKKETEE